MEYRVVQLADGRALGFLDCGRPDGRPIFFFVGFGVSARAAHPDAALSESIGVRVIAVDRPGIGMSHRLTNRAPLDWPRDIEELADKLGLDQFAVLGWSAGGPHALACAYQLAERVSATGLVSCAPPFADKQALTSMPPKVKCVAFMARYATVLLRLSFWYQCRQVRKDADAFLLRSAKDLAEADRDIVLDPRFRDSLKKSLIEACHQGSQGLLDDALAIARPWGFSPSQVRVPVHLWHGEADEVIPVEVGRHMAGVISKCEATLIPGGGHFLYLTHWSDMLQTLAVSM